MGYLYLVLSILFNTVWALCYKVAVRRGCNLNSVNLIVQIGAVLVLLVFWKISGESIHPKVAVIAVVTGVLMCLAALTFFYHMRTGVLAVSWTVIGLAIVFPVMASIVMWHERPTPKQWVGLALIPLAFACFGANCAKTDKAG